MADATQNDNPIVADDVDTGPIVMDFEGVGIGFEPLPEGKYPAHFAKWRKFKAKSSGDDTVEITFTLDEHKGRKAWRNYSLTPQSLWAIKKMLVEIGVPEAKLSGSGVQLHEILDETIGAPCIVALTVGAYEGTPTNAVKYLTGPFSSAKAGPSSVVTRKGF